MISCTPVSLRGRMEPLSLTWAKGGLGESSDGGAGSRPLPRARLHGVQEGELGWEGRSGGLCVCVCMRMRCCGKAGPEGSVYARVYACVWVVVAHEAVEQRQVGVSDLGNGRLGQRVPAEGYDEG